MHWWHSPCGVEIIRNFQPFVMVDIPKTVFLVSILPFTKNIHIYIYIEHRHTFQLVLSRHQSSRGRVRWRSGYQVSVLWISRMDDSVERYHLRSL